MCHWPISVCPYATTQQAGLSDTCTNLSPNTFRLKNNTHTKFIFECWKYNLANSGMFWLCVGKKFRIHIARISQKSKVKSDCLFYLQSSVLWYISSCKFHKPLMPLALRFTSLNSNCVFSFECQGSASLNSINSDFLSMHRSFPNLIQMHILMAILSAVQKNIA